MRNWKAIDRNPTKPMKPFNLFSALAVIVLLSTGCGSQSSKSKYLGLSLNEQYTCQEAGDILKKNTGTEFEGVSEGSRYLKGKDVSFAGRQWSRVEFTFDEDYRLHEVRFFQDYVLDFKHPEKDPLLTQGRKDWVTLCQKLEAKYGDASTIEDTRAVWKVAGKGDIEAQSGSYIVYLPDTPNGFDNLLTVELAYIAEELPEPDWGEGL